MHQSFHIDFLHEHQLFFILFLCRHKPDWHPSSLRFTVFARLKKNVQFNDTSYSMYGCKVFLFFFTFLWWFIWPSRGSSLRWLWTSGTIGAAICCHYPRWFIPSHCPLKLCLLFKALYLLPQLGISALRFKNNSKQNKKNTTFCSWRDEFRHKQNTQKSNHISQIIHEAWIVYLCFLTREPSEVISRQTSSS